MRILRIHTSPCVQQRFSQRKMIATGCEVKGDPASRVGNLYIRAYTKQCLDDLAVTVDHGLVERGTTVTIAQVDICPFMQPPHRGWRSGA